MKLNAFSRIFLVFLLLFPSLAAAQRKNQNIKNEAAPSGLTPDQQDALDLMKSLARELKSESDTLTAAALQARLADGLWQYDEYFAREVFGWAFDAARKLPSDNLPKTERATYATRQAASIRDVLTRLGAHDQKRAEAWFKVVEEEKAADTRSSEMRQFRSELLLQIALQLASTDSAQAQRLGMVALSGNRIPDDFGTLLFALSNINRSQSDELFRAALATLRRNDYFYDGALISLVNYLFSSSGTLLAEAAIADAKLLANYFVDAAWRQARGPETAGLPESSASFYSFMEVRGVPIVAQYAAERLPEFQGQMRELASRLSQVQLENTARLRTVQQQQISVSNRNNYDLDEQIDRASKEKDTQVRDALLNSIAHSLMRSDNQRALKVAAMIEDADVRALAEDDINLVGIQQLFISRAYEEANKTTLKLKNKFLQARVLVQLANKVFADDKDTGRASELLSAASEIVSKTDPGPDKLLTLLLIAQQFARLDSIRGFEILGEALKTFNQLQKEEKPHTSTLSKPRLLRIKTYTVVNGSEMSSSETATIDSIDFSQVAPFVAHDYMQTRLLANKIENPLRRAKFLTAVATAVLCK